MKKIAIVIATCFITIVVSGQTGKTNSGQSDTVKTKVQTVVLPKPFATRSVSNVSKVIGWPQGKTPGAPAGFTVSKYAEGLDNPRRIYIGPNGDVFVAEANTTSDGFKKTMGETNPRNTSANSIIVFKDADLDGTPDMQEVFLSGLNKPFGMLIIGNQFYVANTDALMVYPYQPGQLQMTSPGKKILDLPAGGYNNHWTRNIMTNRDRTKIYITVGSGSNVGENGMANEVRRADIIEINPDGTGERIFASGLRNPVGLGWAPVTNTLWTAVNERDNLGDELVPDYITSVQENGFYGWPFAYFGNHEDPRRKGEQPDLVAKTIIPDFPLGSHTASLGLVFNEKNYFTPTYAGGLFIAQHGSWNRSVLSGYKVVFVPFKDGKPVGPMQDFLTGFIADKKNQVYGRPVDVAFAQDGSLLVTDDGADMIWKVTKK